MESAIHEVSQEALRPHSFDEKSPRGDRMRERTAQQTENLQIIAVDSYRRPYSRKDYTELISGLERGRLKRRVRVVVSDYSHWLSRQPREKFGGVISSEFLPEIDSIDLGKFLAECERIIKPGGVTLHSFLSPVARNLGQRLLIEADSDAKWAMDPPREWFSPHPGFVAEELRRAHFRGVKAITIENRLAFAAKAARTLLRDWGVRDVFWKNHHQYLQQKGLEVPDWVVVSGSTWAQSRHD